MSSTPSPFRSPKAGGFAFAEWVVIDGSAENDGVTGHALGALHVTVSVVVLDEAGHAAPWGIGPSPTTRVMGTGPGVGGQVNDAFDDVALVIVPVGADHWYVIPLGSGAEAHPTRAIVPPVLVVAGLATAVCQEAQS
jgi:hypothetical protein